jgi:hypothetical protein
MVFKEMLQTLATIKASMHMLFQIMEDRMGLQNSTKNKSIFQINSL